MDAFSKSKTEIISLCLVLKVHVLAGLEELNVSVIDSEKNKKGAFACFVEAGKHRKSFTIYPNLFTLTFPGAWKLRSAGVRKQLFLLHIFPDGFSLFFFFFC